MFVEGSGMRYNIRMRRFNMYVVILGSVGSCLQRIMSGYSPGELMIA